MRKVFIKIPIMKYYLEVYNENCISFVTLHQCQLQYVTGVKCLYWREEETKIETAETCFPKAVAV